MKLYVFPIFFASLAIMSSSCSESTKHKTETETTKNIHKSSNPFIGKWILISREGSGKEKETFAESPAKQLLKFETNGYFEQFDNINNTLHRRDFGQWEVNKDNLTLTFQGDDSSTVENIIIESQNENELILRVQRKNGFVIDTYKKQ